MIELCFLLFITIGYILASRFWILDYSKIALILLTPWEELSSFVILNVPVMVFVFST